MNFGKAIEDLKKGYRVTREGWNGKGMFVFMGLPRVEIEVEEEDAEGDIYAFNKCAAESMGLEYQGPVLCLKTAQDTIQVGWLATQSDVLAEDWKRV